ncbi:hypothetical protein [Pseudohoeflea coraliihabitans]|uniref:Chaperone modulatory protein CbpM n=1 Tax=Pseudohoeflea coraliihabitans TaxID=2860393 RepID=A0ABS6WQJ7_9HYPH|nr:hypothetical protein [Pseudohoeflea sp. DP4N28-3]MBW3097923.1 hypothetical protein [Pseudohoeflea sp. DP4N28-3]
MTSFYTEEQVLTRVGRLTRLRLVSYVEADIVRPLATESGPAYRPVDVARLELLSELTEEFELADDTLAIIVSLLDQLHDARADLRTLADAIAREPLEVRARLGQALVRRRG